MTGPRNEGSNRNGRLDCFERRAGNRRPESRRTLQTKYSVYTAEVYGVQPGIMRNPRNIVSEYPLDTLPNRKGGAAKKVEWSNLMKKEELPGMLTD